jgi:O-acetyl-ADP-ribose deacetylase (regulator of RNase III)
MIEPATGDLLQAGVEALVNTVNTEGVMGKGIALQFKQAFPENFRAYKKACDRGEVRPGEMFVFDQGGLAGGPRYIINFPTKRHWKSKSRLEDIESGLRDLVRVIQARRIASIAVPPLGCGNGGLQWSEVEPLIMVALAPLTEVRVRLFAPAGAPPAKSMRVRTERPKMTPGRAGLLGLMAKYGEPGTTFTRLELQKLAYFLQFAGEPLRLEFVKHHFGPYAEQLNHVLERLEGHFIRGYGDRTAPSEIVPDPEGVTEAMAYLDSRPDTLARLERVARLFKGLESPYGAELLATVHWVCHESPQLAEDASKVIDAVHEWSERKRQRFQLRHVEVAWKRLRSEGWLPALPPA